MTEKHYFSAIQQALHKAGYLAHYIDAQWDAVCQEAWSKAVHFFHADTNSTLPQQQVNIMADNQPAHADGYNAQILSYVVEHSPHVKVEDDEDDGDDQNDLNQKLDDLKQVEGDAGEKDGSGNNSADGTDDQDAGDDSGNTNTESDPNADADSQEDGAEGEQPAAKSAKKSRKK